MNEQNNLQRNNTPNYKSNNKSHKKITSTIIQQKSVNDISNKIIVTLADNAS